MTTKVGKYAKKSPQERATHVRKATSQVKAKAAIDFVRTVRGK